MAVLSVPAYVPTSSMVNKCTIKSKVYKSRFVEDLLASALALGLMGAGSNAVKLALRP